jgi:outer membrane lipoprotein-sorting protein
MSYLRQISTGRLLALCAAVVLAAGAVTAIALAAGGGGPTPPPKPLAQAVRDAVNAPQVDGVTARIEFTNRLIDSASLQGSDPILSGAKGRLWASGNRLRMELQASGEGAGGDAQVLVDGDNVTVIDQGSNTVYRAVLPADKNGGKADKADVPLTLARVQQALDKLAKRAVVSGAEPSNVAGRPSYSVKVSPRNDGGLLGSVQAAWDAANGVPLRAGVYAAGSSTPVLEVKATQIDFGPVPAGNLTVPIPAGAKVVDLAPGRGPDNGARKAEVTGVDAVSKAVSFPLAAPAKLVGLPRGEVRLIDQEGTKGALVTYGKGLGGIAVLEAPADAKAAKKAGGAKGEGPGLKLPKISINGASGEELDTALGTVVRFQRGRVAYTVIGSVPPAAAEAAARAL